MKLHERADSPRHPTLTEARKRFCLLPAHVAPPEILRQHAVARKQTVHVVFVIRYERGRLHVDSLTEVIYHVTTYDSASLASPEICDLPEADCLLYAEQRGIRDFVHFCLGCF